MNTGRNQLYEEIEKVIERYSKEADITSIEVIGILEVIKEKELQNLLKHLEK